MKPKLLGVTICFLLRRHCWSKAKDHQLGLDANMQTARTKVCLRCGLTRAVKARKVAP